MKEKKNTKLALLGILTINLSVLLMNVGRLEGIVPDWAIRVTGIVVMICTGLSIVFSVRALAGVSRERKEQNEEKE